MLRETDLAGILASADSTVPYYVPALVAEVRRLRDALIRVENRIMSVGGHNSLDTAALQDAMNLISEALYGH